MVNVDTTTILILAAVIIVPILIVGFIILGPRMVPFISFLFTTGIIFLLPLILSGTIVILGVIIASSNPKVGKILAYVGIGGFLFSLLILEIIGSLYFGSIRVGANLNQPTFTDLLNEIQRAMKNYNQFKVCSSIPVTVTGLNVVSITDSLSCLITGYIPASSKNDMLFYLGFWIFSVAIPLIVLGGIFLDMTISSGIINNKISQRLVGWGLAFMAYRGLIVTYLIFILDYLAAGMAIITLNFIFTGFLLSYTNKVFHQWSDIDRAMLTHNVRERARILLKHILDISITELKKTVAKGSNTDDVLTNHIIPNIHIFYQFDNTGKIFRDIQNSFVINRGKPNDIIKDIQNIMKNNGIK